MYKNDLKEAIFEAFEYITLKNFVKSELLKAINDSEFESKHPRNPDGTFRGNNVTNKYAQYNDLEKDYAEFIEKEPKDYKYNTVEETLKDLNITEEKPLKIKTPIEEVNITVKSVEHIINGGGDSHPPDKTRYKSVNKMLATLKRPLFVNEINGNKRYFKIFQDDNKSKKDIVIVQPDKEVYTNFPADRSSWFFKMLKEGSTIYDIKQ